MSLPLLELPSDRSLRLSPTDVSQFIRLDQCERFLRLRLYELENGAGFLKAYGVQAQRFPPLLSRAGLEWEARMEAAISATHASLNLRGESEEGIRHNHLLVQAAQGLGPGQSLVLFQPRIQEEIAGWVITGLVDAVRLERDAAGALRVLIADWKRSEQVSVEQRLQVAFYQVLVERILGDAGEPPAEVRTAILYHGPAPGSEVTDPDQLRKLETDAAACRAVFGLEEAYLELVADPQAYLEAVEDLVTGPEARARQVARESFDGLFFHLTHKCDTCAYNQLCLKRCAETDDLSLIPHLTAADKRALHRTGIRTISELVALKELTHVPRPDGNGTTSELVPAPGREADCRRVATTWPVGPRLDELIHRGRRYRKWRKDPIRALNYIPTLGYGSLPFSAPDHNPNLVKVYLDAQHDHEHDRLYLVGALVVANANGQPERRRSLVRMTPGPPESAEMERELVGEWVRETLRAIVELADPDENGEMRAPVHLIFYDAWEQRLLLDALSRHLTSVLGAAPALYDFITQLAAFDSPVVTFLDQEIREQRNYPMVCQSLQAVAARLRFDWNTPEPYTKHFHERLFDEWRRLERDEDSEWITGRARFSSRIPLEYAYAAWEQLPAPQRPDPFGPYRGVTPELIQRFQARRLEAMEHIVESDFRGNKQTEKRSFRLPDLAEFQDRAGTLAQALDEFVTIERHVALGEWKTVRLIAPERRVLMGETLLARYYEADQDPGVAERLREHYRRQKRRKAYKDAARADDPEGKVRLTKEQREEVASDITGVRVRLRLETEGLDCSLEEALALTPFKEGERLVLNPRWSRDERESADHSLPFTTTPRQMLHGTRVDLKEVRVEDDAGWLEIEFGPDFPGGSATKGFVFSAQERELADGELYMLDPSPDNWYGYWCARVVRLLAAAERDGEETKNTLYARLTGRGAESPAALLGPSHQGQERFLEGLEAFARAGHFHELEETKREYIGAHGGAPLLLVQGPPGTGKSYGTAFALLARMQAALEDGRDFRVFVSCKTHAATDVLIENVRAAQERLGELKAKDPGLFARYFDRRLLVFPLFRMDGREKLREPIRPLYKDDARPPGEPKAQRQLKDAAHWICAATPGGIYNLVKPNLFSQRFADCLVLDEASQMNLPEAIMAALPLKPDGKLIVVGDHRQMPPIVQHDWDNEPRRTFQEYRAYESLFEALLPYGFPMIRFAESFRLHADMAEFLRREVYSQDGIHYHSRTRRTLDRLPIPDPFTAAVLAPEHPLVVVLHDEASSQTSNRFEQELIRPVLETLADERGYNLDPEEGLGVVVPHRAQRAAIQSSVPALTRGTGLRTSAVDTVERFQGGERTVIVVSATESDREYLLASSKFLLDPRRLTVAASRAKRKLVLVASRSVFQLFSPDEETFKNGRLWKNLLRRTCTELLWEGEREGYPVQVWGSASSRAGAGE